MSDLDAEITDSERGIYGVADSKSVTEKGINDKNSFPAGVNLSADPNAKYIQSSADKLHLKKRTITYRYPHVDLNILVMPPGERNCCAIGLAGIELGFARVGTTKLLDIDDLKGHKYGSRGLFPDDPVGHIYTARGGFVDIGHVRDLADMTRYLSTQALFAQNHGSEDSENVQVKLISEDGKRYVTLKSLNVSDIRIASIVGSHAAYQLSIWHEIFTWYRKDREYSSFSPEDNYSNMLGCLIGAEAFRLQGNYNNNIDRVLHSYLSRLDARPISVTHKATEAIAGVWFDETVGLNSYFLASAGNYLFKRHMDYGPIVTPWLVSDLDGKLIYKKNYTAGVIEKHIEFDLGVPKPTPLPISIPDFSGKSHELFYGFMVEVDTNIVPPSVMKKSNKFVYMDEFPRIVEEVRKEVLQKYENGDQPI